MAPVVWQDRETLWNAVEAAEKEKDNRLGREHVVALPIELDKQGWIALLTDYIQTQFVAEGMCVDAAIHDPDGHAPHAHIITTVRPLNEDGSWQYKTEKEYAPELERSTGTQQHRAFDRNVLRYRQGSHIRPKIGIVVIISSRVAGVAGTARHVARFPEEKRLFCMRIRISSQYRVVSSSSGNGGLRIISSSDHPGSS